MLLQVLSCKLALLLLQVPCSLAACRSRRLQARNGGHVLLELHCKSMLCLQIKQRLPPSHPAGSHAGHFSLQAPKAGAASIGMDTAARCFALHANPAGCSSCRTCMLEMLSKGNKTSSYLLQSIAPAAPAPFAPASKTSGDTKHHLPMDLGLRCFSTPPKHTGTTLGFSNSIYYNGAFQAQLPSWERGG